MKKSEVAKYILGALMVSGFLVVAVVAPNLFSAFGSFSSKKTKYTKNQLYNSFYNLKKNGLISVEYKEGKAVIKLTKNGREKILKYNLEDLKINKPKKWDRKWHLAIFDIPEKFKVNRNYFTAKLRELGFAQLQRSVWVLPYECEDEIDFLKEMYLIRPYVRLVTAEKIDIQHDLYKKFNLA